MVRGLVLSVAIAGWAAAAPVALTPDATEWLSDAAQKARIDSATSELVAVIPGEATPVRVTLARWMEIFAVPGLSVAVFDGHQLLWAKGFGVREAGRPEPVTLDTLFQAGSISKPVSAMAALRYVEAGRWGLDEEINSRLVSWQLPSNELQREQKVTLRRLLSHNAGTTVHGFPGYAVAAAVPTLVQVLDGAPPANTAAVRVDIVPGSRVRYSGGGTSIVQLMMVDQLKKPFPAIMREAVLAPLAMNASTFDQPLTPDRAVLTAAGTRSSGKSVEGRWHIYPEMAAAGLWTTPRDLAKLAIEVSLASEGRSSRVLSQAMTRQMLTVQAGGFGLGFALDPKAGWFGHNGADEGFQAYLRAFTGTGRGIVMMANSDNGFAVFEFFAAAIARAHGWPGYEMETLPPHAAAELLARRDGIPRALTWYRAAMARSDAGLGPQVLNGVGYRLLRSDRVADAVRIFEANVEFYPNDANAYDSLGEGYMASGNTQGAIANYRKALSMDPSNENAKKMLSKLEGK
jgi:CubicO group peptidase (beta-lactamase class C family)